MNTIMILAGGIGARFGDSLPKQYHLLHGRPALEYVIRAAQASQAQRVLVVAAPAYLDELRNTYGVEAVSGGDTRNRSIQNGMDHITAHWPCDKLIVVDGVTATVQPALFNSYFELLDDYELVITALHLPVSLTGLDGEVLDRDRYYMAASPDAIRFPLLQQYFDGESPINSISQQMPKSASRKLNFDFKTYWKIISPQDIPILEALLDYQAGSGPDRT